MARKRGKSKKQRRLTAHKGWRTRRRNKRKRSLAAKRGWATRRRNERLQERLSEELEEYLELLEERGIEEPNLHQYLVTTKYKKIQTRRLDFLVNDYSKKEAVAGVKKFIENILSEQEGWGWILNVPWKYEVTKNPEARPRKKRVEIN